MRKNVYGRKFKRDEGERKALFKSLISALVLNERIKTTEAKAKAIKKDAEKAITKAKKNRDLAKRLLSGILNRNAMDKLINELAPRFANRNGGYTRILRLGKRFGDDAMEVILEWTEKPKAVVQTPAKTPKMERIKTIRTKRTAAPRSSKSTSRKSKKEKSK